MFWRKLYHIIDLPIITNSTDVCTTYLHATISATSYISATYIAPSHLSYAQEAPWCGCWASPGSRPFPFLHFGWWMLRWWMPRYYWIGKAAGVLCEVRWIASRHQMIHIFFERRCTYCYAHFNVPKNDEWPDCDIWRQFSSCPHSVSAKLFMSVRVPLWIHSEHYCLL